MTLFLIDDERVSFRAGWRCVDRISTLKHIGEKGSREKRSVNGVFIDLVKVYKKVNREALRQVLRMYDAGSKLKGIRAWHVDNSSCIRVKRV